MSFFSFEPNGYGMGLWARERAWGYCDPSRSHDPAPLFRHRRHTVAARGLRAVGLVDMCSGEHARVRSWRLQFYPFSLLTGNDTGGMHHFQLDQVFSLQLGAGRFALKESRSEGWSAANRSTIMVPRIRRGDGAGMAAPDVFWSSISFMCSS